jgi:hypothetical protein
LYDFVDVTRQAATMFFSDVHRQFNGVGFQMQMRTHTVTASLGQLGGHMLTIISTLDTLLGTNVNYLLGTWTSRAVALSQDATEADLFLYNAKNQLTLWGPYAQICDYAAKAWSGLYLDYYYQRWSYMISTIISVSEGKGSWNAGSYEHNLLYNMERPWCANSSQTYTNESSGVNPLVVAQSIHGLIHMEGSMLKEQYDAVPDTDCVTGNSMFDPMWTQNPNQLALLCSLTEDCVGFTSDGFMKLSLSTFHAPGMTLYVKKGLSHDVKSRLHTLRPTKPLDPISESLQRFQQFNQNVGSRAAAEDHSYSPPRTPRDTVIQSIPRHRELF